MLDELRKKVGGVYNDAVDRIQEATDKKVEPVPQWTFLTGSKEQVAEQLKLIQQNMKLEVVGMAIDSQFTTGNIVVLVKTT